MNGQFDDVQVLEVAPAVLQAPHHSWKAFIDYVPETLLRYSPSSDHWSAIEILYHLVEMDRDVFPKRIAALRESNALPAFHPVSVNVLNVDIQTLYEEFSTVRTRNLALIAGIAPAELSLSGVHEELGEVTLSNLIHEWAGHDLMHFNQANQVMLQVFIEKSGAWRHYFVNHLL